MRYNPAKKPTGDVGINVQVSPEEWGPEVAITIIKATDKPFESGREAGEKWKEQIFARKGMTPTEFELVQREFGWVPFLTRSKEWKSLMSSPSKIRSIHRSPRSRVWKFYQYAWWSQYIKGFLRLEPLECESESANVKPYLIGITGWVMSSRDGNLSYGPLLYYSAMEWIRTQGRKYDMRGIASDRTTQVSEGAQRFWRGLWERAKAKKSPFNRFPLSGECLHEECEFSSIPKGKASFLNYGIEATEPLQIGGETIKLVSHQDVFNEWLAGFGQGMRMMPNTAKKTFLDIAEGWSSVRKNLVGKTESEIKCASSIIPF